MVGKIQSPGLHMHLREELERERKLEMTGKRIHVATIVMPSDSARAVTCDEYPPNWNQEILDEDLDIDESKLGKMTHLKN